MFKIETHLHVAEVSPCGKLPAAEMVRLYAEAGYHTVFVTDHYKKAYFDRLGVLSWKEKLKAFWSGYEAAQKAGQLYGVTVLPAAEISFVGLPNDYLIYGVTYDFLESHPELYQYSLEDFYKLAQEHQFLVIQAHPHRDDHDYPTLDFIDGVEIFNSNPRHADNSDKTADLCKVKDLYITAGSDAHRLEDVGGAGLLSETPIHTVEDFITLVKSGNAIIYRR